MLDTALHELRADMLETRESIEKWRTDLSMISAAYERQEAMMTEAQKLELLNKILIAKEEIQGLMSSVTRLQALLRQEESAGSR